MISTPKRPSGVWSRCPDDWIPPNTSRHPDQKVEAFLVKIRTDGEHLDITDCHARFFDDDTRSVWCSRCHVKIRMEKENNVRSWKRHRQSLPAESMGLLPGVERLDLVYNPLEGLAKYTNPKLALRHSKPRRGTENYN